LTCGNAGVDPALLRPRCPAVSGRRRPYTAASALCVPSGRLALLVPRTPKPRLMTGPPAEGHLAANWLQRGCAMPGGRPLTVPVSSVAGMEEQLADGRALAARWLAGSGDRWDHVRAIGRRAEALARVTKPCPRPLSGLRGCMTSVRAGSRPDGVSSPRRCDVPGRQRRGRRGRGAGGAPLGGDVRSGGAGRGGTLATASAAVTR
jgi:hypothetical protein